jgi:zinc protease
MALALEAGRMTGLEIDSSEFETERNVVLEERRLGENSPNRSLLEELDAAAFKHHPYGWPVIGYSQDIASITLQDIRRHYRDFYRPDNAVCVVVGDIDGRLVMRAVARHFGPVPRPEAAVPESRIIEPSQRGERRVYLRRPSRNAFLSLAYHTVSIGHPDSYALYVLSTVLSDGESSRLYRRLVRERGLAAYAGGFNKTRIDPTLFTFYAAPSVGRTAAELESALLGEIDDIKTNGVSDWELRKAKNQIEAQLVMSRQRAYELGTQIGAAESQISWRHLNSFMDNISAVTNQDVIRVAVSYLGEDNRTVAVLVPEGCGTGVGQ